MVPKALLPRVVLGPLKFTLLSVLKYSPGISKLNLSVIFTRFERVVSTSKSFGAKSIPFPSLPNVYGAGAEKAFTLNHLLTPGVKIGRMPSQACPRNQVDPLVEL
jgi:hypothetical protein